MSSSCGWASSSDGLDVDGVDFKPASGVIIQDQQLCIPFGARCRGHVEMMWSAVCSEAPTHNSVKEQHPICTWMNGIALRQFADGLVLPKMFWANAFQEA